MTKPIAEATVVGDFRQGTRFADHGRAYEFGTREGRPFVRITFGDREPEAFGVDYTLGAKRYQGYLSKLPDGRIYVLPVFWHVETKRWVDWKEITPVPEGAHDLRQIWNANCFNCHATNLVQGFDVATRRYNTTWTEMGIGCEACHGAGREHVTLMQAWERDPSSKPKYDNSQKNRELGTILKTFSPRSAPTRQVFDTCSYCHGNKTNMFVGFQPGSRYENFALPFLLSDPIPANDLQGEFWPDGRPNRFNRPQALMSSGCFKAGAIACTSCHVAHGSRHPFSLKVNITQGTQGDLLCTQCHTSTKPTAYGPRPTATPAALEPTSFQGAALDKHTFHQPNSAGSRCISCHMSDVNWRLLIRRRDHTFQPPVPEMTVAFGVPNACTTCHDDRTPEWAARQMDQWWGNGARRAQTVAMATTMYRAGSGDTAVIADLVRLGLDRQQSAFIRASAVDYIGDLLTASGISTSTPRTLQTQTSLGYAQQPLAPRRVEPVAITPALVNALIGAASDPEPIVRAAAVKALGASGDAERVLVPLTARLIDETRVVRARTAEVLLALGVAVLPGRAGEALVKAQDEYAVSLTTFPDAAVNHAELGWLEAQRGRSAAAHKALDDAIRLDPRQARPWVVKGVIAARLASFDEALEHWKKARGLDPGYPNIDQLIAEAEKRRRQ
jgi:predicted CXXCH cytochrome family protein